ncbi:hypothetical protein JTE90_006782 [Oedothorax gibbosus]|uniref:Secreted protein n=1 Tax=Oedothorax gibbosus TaxID=931172 RepID=A0AAV6UJS9_9ARAC|nr:hypothetical protein JTE90_006782 [Oedothorax gibbosus]
MSCLCSFNKVRGLFSAVFSLLGPLAAVSLGGEWCLPAPLGFGGLNLRGGRVFGLVCPYLLSSETTANETGLEKSAGKEDPVELDTSLIL